MLQAYIDRAKNLLNSKTAFLVCAGLLIAIGLTYYFIDKKSFAGAQTQPTSDSNEPAAEVVSSSEVIVDVSGAVLQPGIYKISGESRVGDAIALAGGISSDASVQYVSRKLNLAQKLNDSDKIYVPFELDLYDENEYEIAPLELSLNSSSVSASQPNSQQKSTTSSSSGQSSGSTDPKNNESGKTNANTASLEGLDKLSGIGPAYAQKIIDGRPYKDFLELVLKSGVPKSTLEKIKDQISF